MTRAPSQEPRIFAVRYPATRGQRAPTPKPSTLRFSVQVSPTYVQCLLIFLRGFGLWLYTTFVCALMCSLCSATGILDFHIGILFGWGPFIALVFGYQYVSWSACRRHSPSQTHQHGAVYMSQDITQLERHVSICTFLFNVGIECVLPTTCFGVIVTTNLLSAAYPIDSMRK